MCCAEDYEGEEDGDDVVAVLLGKEGETTAATTPSCGEYGKKCFPMSSEGGGVSWKMKTTLFLPCLCASTTLVRMIGDPRLFLILSAHFL